MKKQKIVHVVHSLRYSGAEILVRDLAMQQKREEQYDVSIIAINQAEDNFRFEIDKLLASGIKVISPENPVGRVRKITRFIAAVRAESPSVIFAHSALPMLYARIAKAIAMSGFEVFPVLHAPDDYSSFALRCFEKISFKTTPVIISVSEIAVKNYINRVGVVDYSIIKNGIDLHRFSFNKYVRSKKRAELGLSDQDFLILQVGRVDEVKRQELSYDAVYRLAVKNKNIKLYFVGVPENPTIQLSIQRRIDADGLSAQVVFLGSRSDISDLLSASDLYLMPSKYEAHSIALLEALQSGIYIIASKIDSFKEYENLSGLKLLDPTDVELFSAAVEFVFKSQPLAREERDLTRYSIVNCCLKYSEVMRGLR